MIGKAGRASTIVRLALAAAGLLAAAGAAPAAPRLPFYGDWDCVQVVDGKPTGPLGAPNERYGPEGVTLLDFPGDRPSPLRVERVGPRTFPFRYPDGAVAVLEMQTPSQFTRSTEQHAYHCARPAH